MGLDKESPLYFEQLLALVESEPNFATRVLAAANSAVSAPSESITTLRSALARIGTAGTTDMILTLSVARVFVPRDSWEMSLWRHAIQVAVAARELSRLFGQWGARPDEAYSCGLLHDVGRFVMFQEAPEQLRTIDEGNWSSPYELVREELAICGLTHADLGAMACTHWGMPEIITQVVREHHDPPAKPPLNQAQAMTAIIRLADFAMFPSVMPGTPGLEQADDETIRRTLQVRLRGYMQLELPELRAFLTRVTSEADAIIATTGISG